MCTAEKFVSHVALARWCHDATEAGAALRCWQRTAVRRLAQLVLESLKPDDEWQLRKRASGQPYACLAHSARVANLSLAHSAGFVAAAASLDVALGVDLERERQPRPVHKLAELAFGPRERAAVAAGGPAEFYRIWTLREAMSKASGEGLATVMDGIDKVTIPASQQFSWVQANWAFAYARPFDDLSFALAIKIDEMPTDKTWQSKTINWINATPSADALRLPFGHLELLSPRAGWS